MPSHPHVLITGGSRGIGLAIAHHFARASYGCTLVSRTPATLKAAVSSLPGAQHTSITGDVTDPSFWTPSGIGASLPPSDRISVLVNCAGITQSSLFVKTEPERIQEIVDTNLTSMMIGTRYLLRKGYFGREGNRTIVNIASLLGTHGGHGAVAYAASKAGVLGFTRALAAETGRQGIRVNAVVPGYVETDMVKGLDHASLSQRIPLGRFARPEEIASAALFLAQNEYAHNCVINLDGGLSAV
ncbi:NAD(P)-binding protein [Bimuria novae-zelandiae CBS 107.79]|uniref:NAD(P)-binding protein n=1 Tax=Bimuria novae-zelandiae CBS 107.79 TaxID=1447943 RepID=A0A6A5VA96_9PLEO|nr:NAD(P)-binding protein [Bimuria novae-zelandiae CBS 107.79]